jgi:hypothetical protein
MRNDPLESVYSFVERNYLRMQADDILMRCLDESSPLPIQNLVENLVLAGPSSLAALREMLSETELRKSQVQDDLYQLLNDLEKSMNSYGVSLNGNGPIEAITGLSQVGLLAILRDQEIQDVKAQTDCLQILKDSQDLIGNVHLRYLLLQEIEGFLQDWTWALIVQSVHQDPKSAGPTIDLL